MTEHNSVTRDVLLQIAEDLDSKIAEIGDRVSIAVETDLDEAFFVGTSSSFLRLAAALVRAAVGETSAQDLAGVSCRWSTFSHDVGDRMAEVVAGAECLVETDADREQGKKTIDQVGSR
jgi:hypothetical protein